jgi:hypothetical protein
VIFLPLPLPYSQHSAVFPARFYVSGVGSFNATSISTVCPDSGVANGHPLSHVVPPVCYTRVFFFAQSNDSRRVQRPGDDDVFVWDAMTRSTDLGLIDEVSIITIISNQRVH